MKANHELRQEIKNADIRHWQIAEKLNMHESVFTRLLRKPISPEWGIKIRNAMAEILAEQDQAMLSLVEGIMREKGVLV